ncbi:uncharacterized protein SPAPADRAFT_62026 [Spathaspora passalidarum NRRL Y-27907]|uniref:DUF1749-domain-containing protein n=1 Tax=Spathaspora passalidarum (strain NRRL Y-27907 / 11-Y1) TaxID=619300 RepID=G3AQA8_SPAPN|nr:uncharacterized protein SPAPADRAFT_62026 [Spathaspora passalidarum NRRL Y-27907]EGW31455.1 hypothetical protein SPAPADRAFT_62026 [Spathaspora passalidarum NRRL Y-27907]
MSLSSVTPQYGIVHTYGFNLTAFEFTSEGKLASNILLFVGGLGNGLLNVPYLPELSHAASTQFKSLDGESWSLVQVLLSSAYSGWGTSSLERDVRQLEQAIKYFRSDKGGNRKKVVLMGHSTGCQDTIKYLTQSKHSKHGEIQGGILQAPVSDREAFRHGRDVTEFEKLVQNVYDNYISQGREKELLPEKYRKISFNTPITAYRFYSLASERGDDDYFSSYLTAEDYKESFGKVDKPILVLYSGNDQFVPAYVDKQKLIDTWKSATADQYWSPYSKVLEGGLHDLGDGSTNNAIPDLVESVTSFISTL